MQITTIKVSSKGQIAIPEGVRKSTGIKQGDVLVVAATREGILLTPAAILAEKAEQDIRMFREASWESLKKIWDNPDDERWSKELARRHRPTHSAVRRRAR